MLHFLPPAIRGTLAALMLALNTLILCWPLFIGALLKLLLPIRAVRKQITRVMHVIAETWIGINKFWMNQLGNIQWDVEGLEGLDMHHSYLVTSNHQSWVDILVLQYQFNRRIPFLKFFLKQELIWVPVIGLCWWALEFPFMKRFSKEYLEKHPEKRGEDLATTRRACERYKSTPVSVFNFLEGTRFEQAKHDAQQSPYQYLLKPKTGGVAFVLDAMGEQLGALLDVTLHYPDGNPSFWCLLTGRVPRVVMRVRKREIPGELLGRNYDQDAEHRQRAQAWVSELWSDKDQDLQQLHQRYPARQD
jgi:1-acyl-sn-glycerol-3-phosphate acyltransferase